MKLTCNHCEYTWDYKGNPDYVGKRFYASCPKCHYKVKIHGGLVETLDPELQEMLRTKPTLCAKEETQ